jgi:hypothetical protein
LKLTHIIRSSKLKMDTTETKPVIKTLKELPTRGVFKRLARGSDIYVLVQQNKYILPNNHNKLWALELGTGRLCPFWKHQRVEIVSFHLLVGDLMDKKAQWLSTTYKHD